MDNYFPVIPSECEESPSMVVTSIDGDPSSLRSLRMTEEYMAQKSSLVCKITRGDFFGDCGCDCAGDGGGL